MHGIKAESTQPALLPGQFGCLRIFRQRLLKLLTVNADEIDMIMRKGCCAGKIKNDHQADDRFMTPTGLEPVSSP